MPLEPGTTLGPFQVTAQIGEGGMDEVYRARDKSDLGAAVVVATALMALRSRSDVAGPQLAFAGFIVVIAGPFRFVQRVFFPGGMA